MLVLGNESVGFIRFLKKTSGYPQSYWLTSSLCRPFAAGPVTQKRLDAQIFGLTYWICRRPYSVVEGDL